MTTSSEVRWLRSELARHADAARKRHAAQAQAAAEAANAKQAANEQLSPDERACRDGSAGLEQFPIAFPGKVAACRAFAMQRVGVMATAAARGFRVRHPLAPIGYPPGAKIPLECRQDLLAHAALAPPPAHVEDAEPDHIARRLAATPEQRISAGIHMSVFGDSEATKFRTDEWSYDPDTQVLILEQTPHWRQTSLDPAEWDGRLGLDGRLLRAWQRGHFDSSYLTPTQVVQGFVDFDWRQKTVPPWSDRVKIGHVHPT